jgi:hypothetical protein
VLVADPTRAPDLGGIFADVGAAMGAFMTRYDEREMAVITDYLDDTIRVLREQTARLST